MFDIAPELAEVCGIHAGDGYLRNDGKRRELDISGSLEEKEYYDDHVIPLFNKLFNLDLKGKEFTSRSTYGFVVRNRKIIELFNQIGFPYGSKSIIVNVPEAIMKSGDQKVYAHFLRGLFDTDGTVCFINRPKGKYKKFKKVYHYYPSVRFTTVSKRLCQDVKLILSKLGFGEIEPYVYSPKRLNANVSYTLILYGPIKFKRFFQLVGSKNIVKLSRYLIWKDFGFCPLKLSLQQKKDILKGNLDPCTLYTGS